MLVGQEDRAGLLMTCGEELAPVELRGFQTATQPSGNRLPRHRYGIHLYRIGIAARLSKHKNSNFDEALRTTNSLIIYGVALLAICMLAGVILGDMSPASCWESKSNAWAGWRSC